MCQEKWGAGDEGGPYLWVILFMKRFNGTPGKKWRLWCTEVFCAIDSHNRNRWWSCLGSEETGVHAAHPNIWRDSGLTHEGMRLARRQRYTHIQPWVLRLEMGDPQFQDLEHQPGQDLELCRRFFGSLPCHRGVTGFLVFQVAMSPSKEPFWRL